MLFVLTLSVIAVFFALLYGVPRILNGRQIARNRLALESIEDCYPILMPVCDRPEYLEQVLDGLCKKDRGRRNCVEASTLRVKCPCRKSVRRASPNCGGGYGFF